MAGPAEHDNSDFFAEFLLQQPRQHNEPAWLDYTTHDPYFDPSHPLAEYAIPPDTLLPALEPLPEPGLEALRRSLVEDSQTTGTELVEHTQNASTTREATFHSTPTQPSTRQRTSARQKPARKSKRASKGCPDEFKQFIPLSVHGTHSTVPLRDMLSHVNRGTKVRQEEAKAKAKKEGYVPRPSNSFVLYRSATTARIKDLCQSTNHQTVSLIAGASWQVETDDEKAFYENLARIDNEKHKLAFPGYKFAPVKEAKVSQVGKRPLEESDGEYEPPNTRSKRTRTHADDIPRTPTRIKADTPSSYHTSQKYSSPQATVSLNHSSPPGPYYSHSVPRMHYTPSPLAQQPNMYAYSQPQFYPLPPQVAPQPFDPLLQYNFVPTDQWSQYIHQTQPSMTNSGSALFPDVSPAVPRGIMSPTQQLAFIDPALVQGFAEEGVAYDHENGSHRGGFRT